MEVKTSEYIEITHEMLVRYAGASGDFNPIHTVLPKAQQAGLPNVIAHGMLVMGLASKEITTWISRKALLNLNVRFVKMTVPGEKLKVQASVIEDDVSRGHQKWEVFVVSESEEVKLRGDFLVQL